MSDKPESAQSYFVVTDENSIDFKAILVDYKQAFAGHRVRLTTNYNLLSEFDIVFSLREFPHLMGWEKLTSRNVNAGKLLEQVEPGQLTKETAKRSPLWNTQVKKRMLHYNILQRVFLDQDIPAFVVTTDMKPNRLRLDIVFVVNEHYESVILGFRKANGRDFFCTDHFTYREAK